MPCVAPSARSLGRAKRSRGVIARHISFEVVDCRGRKNHFSTSLIETIPTMLVPSRTGRCRTRFSVITRIHSVMLSLGVAVNNSWVMISLTGVSFKERPFSITFRVKSRSEIIPTSRELSTTGSAPTFLSAISWIASKAVAFGEIDQTAESFRAKSTPTVPVPAIAAGNMAHPETRFKIEISRALTQYRLKKPALENLLEIRCLNLD